MDYLKIKHNTLPLLFQSLDLVEQSGELRQRLRDNTRAFREGLKSAGLTVAGDEHPICPVMVGEAPLAVELASNMLSKCCGIEVFNNEVREDVVRTIVSDG